MGTTILNSEPRVVDVSLAFFFEPEFQTSGGVSDDVVSCELGQSDFQGLMECTHGMGGWLESVIMSLTRLHSVSWLQVQADLRQNL